ncbi:MAG TPA: hypothetical protein VHS03_15895 [Gaiellaceae bacterium]|nr:hypothetical protein [Gaiellaceae bacterium]
MALSLLLGAVAMGVVTLLIHFFPAVGGGVDAGTRWIALGCVPVLILAYYLYMHAVANVQRPDLVRADGKEASRQASIGFRAGTLLTLVSAVFLIAAAPFLCVTIFGSDFHGSIRDLRILALGAFGIAASSSSAPR